MNGPSPAHLARWLAVAVVVATLATEFGTVGLGAGLLVGGLVAAIPVAYAFALGQLFVAVLAPRRRPGLLATPELLLAELGLFVVLWTGITHTRRRQELPFTVGIPLVLAVVAGTAYWVTGSLVLTGGVLLASIVVPAYGLHRYALVFVLETDEEVP